MAYYQTLRVLKEINSTFWWLLMIACLNAALSGCGSARRELPSKQSILSSHLAQGEQIFFQYCHQCHPAGEAGVGPALNNKPLPKFLMKFQTRYGLGAMPAFSEDMISSTELDQLATYLVALRQTE